MTDRWWRSRHRPETATPRGNLPAPTGRIDTGPQGLIGDRWDISNWQVIHVDQGHGDHVYIHTPHSGPEDVVAVPVEDARMLAWSILAAVERVQ